MKPSLLIVDDDEDIRKQMKWALSDEYEVLLASDRESALDVFAESNPETVLLDLGLPPKPNEVDEGMGALVEILAIDPLTKVIIISGQGEKENSIRAIGEGAHDFLCKPIDSDELLVILRRANYVSELERNYQQLQKKLQGESFEQMIGNSEPMQQVFSTIRKVATTDASVLMLGESGTGKEVASLAIHRLSNRRDGAFVTINCGAIPATLLESELFGHEKGAYTGAHTQRDGRIECADGGTLFLDEIGEVPLNLQVKLLRFLQDRTLERVGGRKQIKIDARVFAATNIDLEKAMAEGTFREDLYYRLAVVQVNLPPLRERGDDVVLLATAFLKRFTAAQDRQMSSLNNRAIAALQSYHWPGNVRELENRVKRAVIMCEGQQITPADLDLETAKNGQRGPSLREAREKLDRDLVQRALLRNNWKVSPAARELGVSRPTFYELMDRLKIDRSH